MGNIPASVEKPNGDRIRIWDEIYARFGGSKLRDEL